MADSDQLTAAQRSKIRRLSAFREPEEGEEAGEINVVPYLDIVTNIVMFVLASIAVIFTASIDTSPPRKGGGGVRVDKQGLNLTVLIVNDGFSIKAAGGNVATGCAGAGPGLAVPKKDNEYNYDALNDCAKNLKNSSADFKDETEVTLTANPGSEYQVVIKTMDALRRAKEGDELFPDVKFGLPR